MLLLLHIKSRNKILSFLFMLLTAFMLYSTFKAGSNLMIILYLIFTGMFMTMSISLYLSTSSHSYYHAFLAYSIFECIILFNAIEDIYGIVMLYMGELISPMYSLVYRYYLAIFLYVLSSFCLRCIYYG